MEKIKKIETTINGMHEEYMLPVWVYNYLKTFESLGFKLSEAVFSGEGSENVSAYIDENTSAGVNDYTTLKKIQVTQGYNVVIFTMDETRGDEIFIHFPIKNIRGRIKAKKSNDGYKLSIFSDLTNGVSVMLSRDELGILNIVVESKNTRDDSKNFKDSYRIESSDERKDPMIILEGIATQVAPKIKLLFGEVFEVLFNTMIKDPRLCEKIGKFSKEMDDNDIELKDGKVFIDEFHSYPSYVLGYLEAFRIKAVAKDKYLYEGHELKIKFEDDYIYLYSDDENNCLAKINDEINYFARISQNGTLELQNEEWKGSIAGLEYGRLVLRGMGDCHYYISVQPDLIGNVTISISTFNEELGSVEICIGEKHDTPQNYLNELKAKIDFSCSDVVTRIVEEMFNDDRILNRLSELISKMANDVDAAYIQKARELWNARCAKLNEFLEELDSDYDEGLRQLEECAQAFERTYKKGDKK